MPGGQGLRRALAVLTVLVLVACGSTQSQAELQSTARSARQGSTAGEPSWEPAGRMALGRLLFTATRLEDGRVLVAGGFNQTAEVYAPASRTWSRTGDTLTAHRYHTATRLKDGRVLAAGGEENWHTGITAEVYSPATEQWSAAGNMVTARSHHASVLLPSGRVLVMGGRDGADGMLASAEEYDPATNTWSLTGSDSLERLSGRAGAGHRVLPASFR